MSLVHRRTAVRHAGIALLFVTLAASMQSIAYGQPMTRDRNCNYVPATEKQQVEEAVCEGHAGCRMVSAVVEKTCKAVDFFRNLGGSMPPSGQLTNEDVIDAATADIPKTPTGQRILDNARNAAKSAYGAVGEFFRTSDGQVGYAETRPASAGLKSGTIISSNGTMARGTFDSNNRLQGPGQLVTADGRVRAGDFRDNRLNGTGFDTERENNRIVLREGTFDGDTPVGEIVVTFGDGSKVREIWVRGRMAARGTHVPKGQIPPPVRQPRVEMASAPATGAKSGMVLVNGAGSQRRYELWCGGRMVDAGRWSALRSLLPDLPNRRECTPQELVEEEADFSHKDAIQRTLGPPKLNPAAGTGPSAESVSIWRGDRGTRLQLTARPGGFELRAIEPNGEMGPPKFLPGANGTYRFQLFGGEAVYQFVDANTIQMTSTASGVASDIYRRER